MRPFVYLIALTLLAGCDGGMGPVDGQKVLAGMDGPKVPSVQDTLMESAKGAEAQGNFQQAGQLYAQALEKHPDDKTIALALADATRRSGDNDRAISYYDGILAKDGGNAAAKEGKGLALMAKGDFDTPVTLFQDVLKAEPNRWKTLNGLGILFTTRGMQPEAQQYFQAALKSNPGNATVLNNIGLSQALDRKNEQAIATLQQASNAAEAGSQQRKRIDMNTALVYAIDGKLDEAKTIASSYYSGAALNNNLGLYAHLAKDDSLARTYLNMALTESKTYYSRAWENLQTLGDTPNTNATGVKKTQGTKEEKKPENNDKPEKPEAKKTKTDAKPSAKSKPGNASDAVSATDKALSDN